MEGNGGIGLPWKLRHATSGTGRRNIVIILKIAAPEQCLFAMGVELIVHTSNVGVETEWHRTIKSIPSGVQSVSNGIIVRCGVGLQDLQHCSTLTDMLRVDGTNFVGA